METQNIEFDKIKYEGGAMLIFRGTFFGKPVYSKMVEEATEMPAITCAEETAVIN